MSPRIGEFVRRCLHIAACLRPTMATLLDDFEKALACREVAEQGTPTVCVWSVAGQGLSVLCERVTTGRGQPFITF